MKRTGIIPFAAGLLLCALLLGAQQQTGAPAGIPVPTPPVQPSAYLVANPESAHFRIHVVDGRNGDPIRDAHVRLWYDEPVGAGYQPVTDPRGNADMPAPIGEPVRVLVDPVGLVDCRKPVYGDPPQGYSIENIARAGVAAQNTCGPVAVRTRPGEFVLFVRPARWYEGLNRSSPK